MISYACALGTILYISSIRLLVKSEAHRHDSADAWYRTSELHTPGNKLI